MFVVHNSLKNSFEYVFGISPRYNNKSTHYLFASALLTVFILNWVAFSRDKYYDRRFINYMITSFFLWIFMFIVPFSIIGYSPIKWPFEFVMVVGLLIQLVYGIILFTNYGLGTDLYCFVIALIDLTLTSCVLTCMFIEKIKPSQNSRDILDFMESIDYLEYGEGSHGRQQTVNPMMEHTSIGQKSAFHAIPVKSNTNVRNTSSDRRNFCNRSEECDQL